MRAILFALAAGLAACSQQTPRNSGATAPSAPAVTRIDGENWTIDRGASAIRFAATVSGAPLAGSFEAFDASVRFDPAALDAAKASVAIDTTSAKTGDKQQESALATSEWFGGAPATFESDSFVKTDDGYEMQGRLTIRDNTLPVTIPFTFVQNGAAATVTGRAVLDRLAFDLGEASDPSGELVSKNIEVTITLNATQK